MEVDLVKLEASIKHMLHGCQKKGDFSKKEIREQIHGLAKQVFAPRPCQDLKELMGRVLDLTRNQGTNLFMRAMYYIFQGSRVHVRNKAAEIILKIEDAKNIQEEEVLNKIHACLDSSNKILAKALIAKYRSHGFSKKELKTFTEQELKSLYSLAGELNLGRVPHEKLTTPSFLSDLMKEAIQKKDVHMGNAILATFKKIIGDEEGESIQHEIIDRVIRAEIKPLQKLKDKIAATSDDAQKMDLVKDYLKQRIEILKKGE
jgi:hypothetical protein